MPHSPYFTVHTVNLLQEILNNPGTGILTRPLQIFARLLAEVADRAIVLNDPELNRLMVALTLYEQADPSSSSYMGAKTRLKVLHGGTKAVSALPKKIVTVQDLTTHLHTMPSSARISIYGSVPSKPFSLDRTIVDNNITKVKFDDGEPDHVLIYI